MPQRSCAVCNSKHVDDEEFEFICLCDNWQGVCLTCLAPIPMKDWTAYAQDALGKDHALRQRLPGTTGPPVFESLMLRRIRNGSLILPPGFEGMQTQLAALPHAFQGIVTSASLDNSNLKIVAVGLVFISMVIIFFFF